MLIDNTMTTKEFFYFDSDLQVEQSEDFPTRLIGYSMKFGVLSHDRGGFRDVFLPGVFGDSITGTDTWDVKASPAMRTGRSRFRRP